MTHPIPDAFSDDALRDLTDRLRRTGHAATLWGDEPGRGITSDTLSALLDHWRNGFDWRPGEGRIRSLPWQIAGEGTGALRVVHQPAREPGAPTVLLLHGWPDSVLRFERLLPLLHGVNVVAPALPGFPFALPIDTPISAAEIAARVADSMTALGYDRYVVSAGDVGGIVAEILSAAHPDRVAALHLTNLAAARSVLADASTQPADAAAFLTHAANWRRTEAGFVAEQASRPNTLAAALGDSPVGLLAWVGEKLLDWSQSVDGRPAFTPDELLTWVTVYWLSGAIGTSFSTYVQPSTLPARIETPTVLSVFGHDFLPAPRSFVEQFVRVEGWREHESGGHFAAWEQPGAYASDLRAAIAVAAAQATVAS